jgi:hypothetical protein
MRSGVELRVGDVAGEVDQQGAREVHRPRQAAERVGSAQEREVLLARAVDDRRVPDARILVEAGRDQLEVHSVDPAAVPHQHVLDEDAVAELLERRHPVSRGSARPRPRG